MSLTEQLLRPLLASPAKPLITHYDDRLGSRVELSVATTVNWAAKTANWLVDEFDVEPGDHVAVRLPAHWQTAGVLLGAWWCGARVVAEPSGARVVFVGPDEEVDAPAVAVVSLDPMGRGLSNPPGGSALDYLNEARLSGDQFSPLSPIPGDTPALGKSTVDEILTEARARAGKLGLTATDRVLSTLDWTVPEGVLDGLLVPLAASAHLVQVTHADPAKLDARREAERTTADLS
ncbi:TIGR03089 family protein [Amycolatopsis saalfeldensis]|uniref:TIGR03089 family protein n=1 Tax=Amycolatopsis saalfeldensis TaxID=394193 RepID=A0A1H8YKL8_9PSEU|nr:TIGR03089 family protein [Amycolatopsis saalfeldensis]SEP52705.1 TIGR03089 family protein [Amycolatopsis saalfeldensis]